MIKPTTQEYRKQLEKFDGKAFDFKWGVDHECKNYPDGLFFNILTTMICPFCKFVWDDITKHPSWKKITKKEQNEMLPIWKKEFERMKIIYLKKEKN